MFQANKLRQVGLGVQLRDMRHRAGMTTRAVAESLGVSPSSINRTEVGRRAPDREEVASLCALFGITGEEKQDLLDRVATRKENTAWLSDESDQLSSLLVLEREAKAITYVEVASIPGLAQTGDYAHLMLSSYFKQNSQLERQVTTRLGRQSILSKARAPTVSVILDESVLHRSLDNPAVMREQLDYLLVLQVRANVSIRVVPLNAPSPTLFGGGFCVYELPDGSPYVLVEGTPCGMFTCDPSDVRPFRAPNAFGLGVGAS